VASGKWQEKDSPSSRHMPLTTCRLSLATRHLSLVSSHLPLVTFHLLSVAPASQSPPQPPRPTRTGVILAPQQLQPVSVRDQADQSGVRRVGKFVTHFPEAAGRSDAHGHAE